MSFQSQSHDITQGSTPNPQRDVAAVEDTAEGFAEEFEAQARVKETHVVAEDIVEPAPVPLVQDAASETDAAERDTGALAVPHITSTADIYDGPGECEDGLRNAGNVSAPTASLNHEDHTADTLFGTSSSALLLPALSSVDRLEPCDDSLQPSAALVTRLSTFSRCADLRDSPVSAESDGGCPAVEGLSSKSDDLTEDTHPLHASGTGPLPPPVPIDNSCEEITIEDNAARFFQDFAGTLQDLSSPPAEETIGESEDNDVLAAEGGLTQVDIMQSAVLVSGADAAGEQDAPDPDSDRDLEWTTVDREDYGAEVYQEPVFQPGAVQEEGSNAAEASQGDVLSHSIDASMNLPTSGSKCAQVDVAPPFPHAPSITVEEAPAVTATILDAIPSAEATSATTVALPGAASGQSLQVTHLSDVAQPRDGYIGPLFHKPKHARVHSLDKPDWAVAPDIPKPRIEAPQPKREGSKPKAGGNKPCHWQRKRPQGANEKGADGSARKAPAPRQTPKTRGKDENQKTVPYCAPAAQKTQAENDARGEPRRRSARLARE